MVLELIGTVGPDLEGPLPIPIRIKGRRDRLPRANRIPLNRKGPIYSMPTRWATKAKPQMAAVVRRRMSALRVPLRNRSAPNLEPHISEFQNLFRIPNFESSTFANACRPAQAWQADLTETSGNGFLPYVNKEKFKVKGEMKKPRQACPFFSDPFAFLPDYFPASSWERLFHSSVSIH